MIVIGLTGSIATGKTTVSKWLKELHIPVHEADETVHRLFREDSEVINSIAKQWPHCVIDGQVDRIRLRAEVLKDSETLTKLEYLLHPKVRKDQIIFIEKNKKLGKQVVVLDVPLLYESKQDELCDCVLLIYCSPEIQRQRAQDRGVDTALLDYFLKLQLSLSEKLSRAEFSLNTDGSFDEVHKNLVEKMREIGEKYGVTF